MPGKIKPAIPLIGSACAVGADCLSRPARNERGESRGGGCPSQRASTPRPLLPQRIWLAMLPGGVPVCCRHLAGRLFCLILPARCRQHAKQIHPGGEREEDRT